MRKRRPSIQDAGCEKMEVRKNLDYVSCGIVGVTVTINILTQRLCVARSALIHFVFSVFKP